MQEKLIPLVDAFRAILGAMWPKRPALADEIQSILFFHYAPKDRSTGRRLDPEAQAADDALASLRDAVVAQRIRLFGRLGDGLPHDIHPTEVEWNGIHVFDGTIEVYGERGRTLRTYRHVHCYEHEVKAILTTGRSNRVGARPRADWDTVEAALRLEVKTRGMIGPDNDDPKWRMKADVERWVSALLEARNEVVGESTVRGRVSEMLNSIEAGN
jgi:hypothetical protein